MISCILASGCRDKCNDCDTSGQLEPPYGVVISAVGGEVAFFDLETLEFVLVDKQQGWATACELLPVGSRLVTTDNEAGGIAVYQVPTLEKLQSIALSGTPIDVKLDHAYLSAHVITNNGLYFRVPFSTLIADTADTGPSPRTLRFRPPSDQEAWIPCTGDRTVRVINMLGLQETARLSFAEACTDVCFSTDGSVAYCAVPGSGKLYKFSSHDYEILDSLSLVSGVVDLAISADGRYIAAADSINGIVRVYDLSNNEHSTIRCGTEARRVRYSSSRSSFFVICPQESWVLRIDPTAFPAEVRDTLVVERIPQCMSFLE